MNRMSPPNETTKDLAAKFIMLKVLLALDELDTSRDDARFNLCQAEIIAVQFRFFCNATRGLHRFRDNMLDFGEYSLEVWAFVKLTVSFRDVLGSQYPTRLEVDIHPTETITCHSRFQTSSLQW